MNCFSKTVVTSIPLLLLAGCSGPTLTAEAQAVHSITDTDGCEYLLTEPFTGAPATVHDYIKQRVVNHGGNAYKVLSANTDSAWTTNDVDRITYEVWRCPN